MSRVMSQISVHLTSYHTERVREVAKQFGITPDQVIESALYALYGNKLEDACRYDREIEAELNAMPAVCDGDRR